MQKKTGWYKVYGLDVWVEDGIVRRAIAEAYDGSSVTLYPYRLVKDGSWTSALPTLAALRAGIKRETYRFM